MKIIKEVWDDVHKKFIKTKISELEAIQILSNYYNNAKEIVKIPCYYRLPYGGIEIKSE